MLAVVIWYALVSAAAWLVWPLAFHHLRHLPDRGYLSSRALGLLLVGYVFWLMASLGLVANSPGAMLLAAAIVGGVALWQYRTRPNQDESLTGWLRDHLKVVLLAEVLFIAAFAGWTFVRAHDPALNTTEKPMELMFLNGIRQSTIFPPRDPWLAGYAISYYYYGYVLVAMLADLSGVASEIAFNVAIGLLFALTVQGAYAIVFNLNASRDTARATYNRWRDALSPLLGPLFVALIGNLAGAFELLRALRFPRSPAFWTWLDLKDLEVLPQTVLWPPDRWRFWWWWRASRVINERDLTGTPIGLQPIDEFPMFSFLLGDMHPHVLALPFVLLALALAFNLALSPPDTRRPLTGSTFALYAVCIGGLVFLNTWDLPVYLFVAVGAYALREKRAAGTLSWEITGFAAAFGLSLALATAVLYLPFFLTFRSQAGGILPNALFPTPLPNFVVMFGPMLFVLIIFSIQQATRKANWLQGTLLALGILLMLVAVMVLLSTLSLREELAQNFLLTSTGLEPSTLPVGSVSRANALQDSLKLALQNRLAHPAVALLLTTLLALSFSRLLRRDDRPALQQPIAADFALLLLITGALLTLGPEFVYLRDTFGQRMNTVFKFYYAAWLLFGLAAAYATWHLTSAQDAHPALRGNVALFTGLLLVAGLAYPVLAIPAKANFETDASLDGIAFLDTVSPGDVDAIRWLRANADSDAIILEAVGGSYSSYGRVAAATGLPTLLGWPGHEHQWRGTLDMAGSREADVETIYSTPDMILAQDLLNAYDVTYIYVGALERNYESPTGLQKFDQFLTAVYRDTANGVAIYHADQPLAIETPEESETNSEASP